MTVKDLIKNLKFAETVEIKNTDGEFLALFNTSDTRKVEKYLDSDIYRWYPCFFDTSFEETATLCIQIYDY